MRVTLKQWARKSCWLMVLLCSSGIAYAEEVTLTARVSLTGADQKSVKDAGNIVLWLSPVEGQKVARAAAPQPRLVQKNKTFEPHVLVVPVGSVVQFPNQDPFFHNVFSLFEGKRFDLGLYEAGTARDVHFDRPGISYIFCNIHPQMSAVVIALDTPYYGISNARGEVVIPRVPAGRYLLQMWYEEAVPETLKTLNREVTVSESNSTLGVIRLATANVAQAHKNKYGRDYEPTTPNSPAYQQP